MDKDYDYYKAHTIATLVIKGEYVEAGGCYAISLKSDVTGPISLIYKPSNDTVYMQYVDLDQTTKINFEDQTKYSLLDQIFKFFEI